MLVIENFTALHAAAIALMAFVGAAGTLWCLLSTALADRLATDIPNERSLHQGRIPRVGGWGVIPAAVAIAWASGAGDLVLIAIVAVLFSVSYLDDRFGLPIALRMLVHIGAAASWLVWGPIELSLVLALLAGGAIVWSTNLFNFMDGADGLAGGMALSAFSAYAFVAAAAGNVPLAIWSIALVGAAAGFVLFNFHPARVFLGDAGSISLGFLAGAFGVWGWAGDTWPVWFPFLVSAPFFLDATVTLFRRALRGDHFWRAHREHYYQRLIRSGWSHRRTALWEYAAMAGSCVLAVVMLQWPPGAQLAGIAVAAASFALSARAIDRRWHRFQGAATGRRGAVSAHMADDADRSTRARNVLK